MSDLCTTTYYAEERDWSGQWQRVTDNLGTSMQAVNAAREVLADAGYHGCALRVIKVHTHTTVEVLEETTTAREVTP